jgi:hypothetical protein
MRLSRRLTGVLLVLVCAGALAPTALAGKRKPPPPPPPTYVAPEPITTSMVDIEALR